MSQQAQGGSMICGLEPRDEGLDIVFRPIGGVPTRLRFDRWEAGLEASHLLSVQEWTGAAWEEESNHRATIIESTDCLSYELLNGSTARMRFEPWDEPEASHILIEEEWSGSGWVETGDRRVVLIEVEDHGNDHDC